MLELNKVYNMPCEKGILLLEDFSVDLIVTSPPYAEQRKNQYGGIPESDYPEWMVNIMKPLKRVLKPNASVFINIRPHIKNGIISDYVLRTRLALREDGWNECEELIWIKPDSPPLGSIQRPRRAWESILWFSLFNKPYCNPKAVGTESNRIVFENSKFEHGGKSHIHAGQKNAKQGIARGKDYIEIGTGKIDKNIKHPAMFPIQLPEYLIKMCSKENDLILDIFAGSSTTGIASLLNNRNYIGFEIDKGYCDLGCKRIEELMESLDK